MAQALRFSFCREDGLKYISHLDILRVFERALKRSGLPVAYTQGFNPRQKLVFGLPMPIGLTSDSEYADIEFDVDVGPEHFIDAINQSLPEGLKVLGAVALTGRDNIMNQISAARYEIVMETKKAMSRFEMDHAVHGLLAKEELAVMKKTKKGMRPVNIRPLIYSLSVSKQDINVFLIEAFLSAGMENNLRPDLFMEAFAMHTGIEARTLSMHRKALLASACNEWKSPFEVAHG